MSRASFEDFLNAPFVGRNLANNLDAMKIFDILNDEKIIAKAIELSEEGKPALLAGVSKVEDYIDSRGGATTFPLNVARNCQLVGIMMKIILAPFNYTPNVNKPMETRYFHSAMTYKRK